MLHVYLAALALTLAATAAVAAGCGGSSTTTTTTTTSAVTGTAPATTTAATSTQASTTSVAPAPITIVHVASGKPLPRARWIARGDEICGQLIAERESIKVKKVAEIPRVLPQVAAYERTEVSELAKLIPPSSQAEEWQRFLAISLQRAEDTGKIVALARLGDGIAQSPILTTIKNLKTQLAAIAAHNGFKECPST